jgi:hypothetical protein
MTSNRATVTLPTDEQILVQREFDAPRELVYKAYTSPELVSRWWHAKRGEVTLVEIDLPPRLLRPAGCPAQKYGETSTGPARWGWRGHQRGCPRLLSTSAMAHRRRTRFQRSVP